MVLQNLISPSLLISFVQVCLQNLKTLKILHLGLEICPFWTLCYQNYLAQEFRKAHAASACLSSLESSQMFVRVLIKCCAENKVQEVAHIWQNNDDSVTVLLIKRGSFLSPG